MNNGANQNEEPQVVERTGLALVHEGERIFPAPDALAQLTAIDSKVVNYYFPVEIEIIGVELTTALEERIYTALHQAFEALA